MTKKIGSRARGRATAAVGAKLRLLHFKSLPTAITTAVQKLNENKLANIHVIRSFIGESSVQNYVYQSSRL